MKDEELPSTVFSFCEYGRCHIGIPSMNFHPSDFTLHPLPFTLQPLTFNLRLSTLNRFLLGHKLRFELVEHLLEIGLERVVESLLFKNTLRHRRVRRVHEGVERLFKALAVSNGEPVEISVRAGENDNDLLFDRKGRVLILLEHFGEALAAIELGLRGFVEVASELREGFESPV